MYLHFLFPQLQRLPQSMYAISYFQFEKKKKKEKEKKNMKIYRKIPIISSGLIFV